MYGLVNFTPYGFQGVGIDFAFSHNYCIIADEMGLGKTLQALARSVGLRTLIVCPASLKDTWKQEIKKFCEAHTHLQIFRSPTDIIGYTPELDDYVIINYEQLRYSEDLFEWAELVISDEAHKLKNLEAQRTVYFEKNLYDAQVPYCLLLTGTPIQNRVEELYALLVIMSYSPVQNNGLNIANDYPTLRLFCEEFSHRTLKRVKGGKRVVVYRGVKNKEKLKTYLRKKFIRRKQKDVHELPGLIYNDVIASYKNDPALEKEFMEHSNGRGKDITAKEKSAMLKTKFTIQYIKELLETTGKIVVFTDHVKPAEAIAEAFGTTAYTGKTSQNNRTRLKNEFQDGKTEVIVLTFGAGSEGLTLTKANVMVLNDYPWVPGILEQAIKRIYRISQLRRCIINSIVGSFQDSYIMLMIKEKMKDITEVIG